MSNIQSIIERLEYEKSDNLYYLSQINDCAKLSWHDRRVLSELLPYAVYVVDGRVLVAFFDDLHMERNIDIQCKVWNAQIPVIISDEGDWIKIYSGKSMKVGADKKVRLSDIISYKPDQCDAKNDFSFWNVTNSVSIALHEKALMKENLNDFLIDNLRYITSELKDRYQISFANKLVLRILFIRYLIDRGVNIGYKGLGSDIKRSKEVFLDIVRDKDEILALFRYLKKEFNGNLFEMNEQEEEWEINESVLAMLYDFLTAQIEMKTGQMCLFPFYDFNIIPIELISNIYEILLGKEKQNKDKAFYTPEYLVDYMVQRTVGKELVNNKECTVFDPSCGSGIFLVKSLRRILEKNASDDGYIRDKEEICRLAINNIYGVDYSEEAVDVTIFSLYITLFDYQDPKNLKDFKLPLLKGKNILFGDFFDENVLAPVNGVDFKYILGNPPWGRVEQERYKRYCASKNVIPQDGEICVAFLLKAQEIGNEDTECSLVIPSKILYKGKKPSLYFRKNILSNVCMQQVLELSAVRKQIFKGAIAPATVMSFLCQKAQYAHKLEYISLKPNKFLRLFGIIMIESDDIKYVEQELLIQHDELWKILVYGGYWDFELLNNLKKTCMTVKEVEDKFRFRHGKGIQDHEGDGKDSSHLKGRKLLDSDGCIEHFRLNLDRLAIFNKEKIHRPREKKLFEPPYVFFKKGLDCNDYSVRAVYSEERLVYKETVNCIKGEEKDKNILLNLAGLFNSSLYAYFNLMLGSSAGIEREQVFLKELEKYPYAYSDELVKLVQKLQAGQGSERDDALRKELDECVLGMYGLQNNYFVDYALKVQIPILCGRYIGAGCNAAMLEQYAKVFSSIWVKRLERSNLYYSIKLYPDIKGKFAAFYMQFSFEKTGNNINIIEDADDHLEILTDFMIYKLNDCFYQTKNIAEFEDDSFVIVKPIDSKNWHEAVAIKDSYKVLNAVLLGEEGCEWTGR